MGWNNQFYNLTHVYIMSKKTASRRGKGGRTTKKRGTLRKLLQNKKCTKASIVKTMMEMLNIIKLYHWNTHSYSQHKATDELYARLSDNVDKFVEVGLGKKGGRITHWTKNMEVLNFEKSTNFKTRLYEYRRFFIYLDACLHPEHDTDLLSIRDEILADLNQFLYLFTLK